MPIYNMRLKILSSLAVPGLAIGLTAATLRDRPVTSADAGATESNITRLTASLMERSQFGHHPLDAELAGKFFDRYLDSLDPAHDLFLQTDVEGFDKLRSALAQATSRTGDTS